MDDLFNPIEVLEDAPKKSRRGGPRPGSGRKPEGYVKPPEQIAFDKARAHNEAMKAALNELDLKVKTGEYVSRAAVRQATATAFASIAQTLRSIPDNVERKLGVSAEVAQEIERIIDEVLDDLSADLEMMTGPVDAAQ